MRRASEGTSSHPTIKSAARKAARATARGDKRLMRRFELAIACVLACLFSLADIAPGSYEPASAAIAADPSATARLETEPAIALDEVSAAALPDDDALG